MGKHPADVFSQSIQEVAMPKDDPVHGAKGPLTRLWSPGALAKL
jgi:uncharacterized protein YjlB